MHSFYISSLELNNYRSYRSNLIEFDSSGAFIYGANGVGKTNIIEAIYFLFTGRSHRGAKKKHMIHNDTTESYISANIVDKSAMPINIGLGLNRSGNIKVKLNNERIKSLSQWFKLSNIVSFSPFDIDIVIGEPSNRRKYLDLLFSQIDVDFIDHLVKYKKACKNRNILLSANASDLEFEVYESEMAEHASYIIKKRYEMLEKISDMVSDIYKKISDTDEKVEIVYTPSLLTENNTKEQIYSKFLNSRKKDIYTGYTSIGPHRDDFKCYINGKLANLYGSRGQSRTIAISLRLCSLDILRKEKNKNIIILLDDAFGDLDKKRSNRIYPIIKGKGQIFITSVSPEDKFGCDLNKICVSDGYAKAA